MFVFLIMNLFLTFFSILPNWNLTLSSIDLLKDENSYTYTISEKRMYELSSRLDRKIIKSDDGKINYENELFIDGNSKGKVNFENIESLYRSDQTNTRLNILCPMVKHHPIHIDDMNEIYNNNLGQSDVDWNLKCYFHCTGFFFTFYLDKEENQVFDLKNDKSFDSYSNLQMGKVMYDFKLVNKESDYQGDFYPICAIVKKDKYIQFVGTEYILNKNNHPRNGFMLQEKIKILTKAKKYSQANFLSDTNDFYYFTYNNIYDFSSGFSTKTVVGQNYFTNDVEVENNYNSPFEFIDEVEIKKMKIIPYTKYVYYLKMKKHIMEY